MDSLLLWRFLFLLFYLVILWDLCCASKRNNGTGKLKIVNLGKISLDTKSEIEEMIFPESRFRCGSEMHDQHGFVKSPKFPHAYVAPVSCHWRINANRPGQVITISLTDLDIEFPPSSVSCRDSRLITDQCCKHNFLEISSSSRGKWRFCGKLEQQQTKVFISESSPVNVTFNVSSNNHNGSHGFYIAYVSTPKHSRQCLSTEFHCNNGKCIPKKWRCNGQDECGDGSDETHCLMKEMMPCNRTSKEEVGYYKVAQRCDSVFDCPNLSDELGCSGCLRDQFRCGNSSTRCLNASLLCDGTPDCDDFSDELTCKHKCPKGEIRCGSSQHCYNPATQRCNKILDCPNGADELNCREECRGRIACPNGVGCFTLEERCNGVIQCSDSSDEKNCTLELCNPENGLFLCSNARCIPSMWTCDRSADCYDAGDEMRCLKNGVITSAIIGSLICGLLLVIAISCACKLVALRHMERYRSAFRSGTRSRFPSHEFPFTASPGDLDATLFRLDNTLLFREPPPSYDSAMGGTPETNTSYTSYVLEQLRRHRNRTRRARRNQRARSSRHAMPNGLQCSPTSEQPRHSGDRLESTVANQAPLALPDPALALEGGLLIPFDANPAPGKADKANVSGHAESIQSANSSVSTILSSPSDNLTIELEMIPPLTHFDCDSQPLIR